MDFENYLINKGLQPDTAHTYNQKANLLLSYLGTQNIQIQNAEYHHLQNFIRYKQRYNCTKHYINQLLCIARYYFDYLIQTGEIKTNIAAGLIIKGVHRQLPGNLLTEKELENLYESYPNETLPDKRNKVILSLLIHQGITAGELELLAVEHLNLRKATIHVPGSLKSNSRILGLKSYQIFDLMEYTTDVRPKLIKLSGKQSDKLIISTGAGKHLRNTLQKLFVKLQNIDPQVKTVTGIRCSVITNWLKTNNLRQVQYWAGHKYVSSTERYQATDLEELSTQIQKYHPIKDTKNE